MKPLIAGNWKMNGLKAALGEVEALAALLRDHPAPAADILYCPPATLLAALGPAPLSIDELARATGLPMRALQGALLELTLAERIERHGAQLVSLRAAPG